MYTLFTWLCVNTTPCVIALDHVRVLTLKSGRGGGGACTNIDMWAGEGVY